jgi:hypothetical protein
MKPLSWVLLLAGLLNIVAFVGACTAGDAARTTGGAGDAAYLIPEVGGPVGAALHSMSKRFEEIEAKQKNSSERMNWSEWLYGITGIGLTGSTVHSKLTSRKRAKRVITATKKAFEKAGLGEAAAQMVVT